MSSRFYYHDRQGHGHDRASLTIDELRKCVHDTYWRLRNDGYLTEAFGYKFKDVAYAGTMRPDPRTCGVLKLHKRGLFPPVEGASYSEEDLFAILEFMHDYVSAQRRVFLGLSFDRNAGQKEYRGMVNDFLQMYGVGWEMSQAGEICRLPESGLESIFGELPSSEDKNNIDTRLTLAISSFRRYPATAEARRDAVRTLTDILEYLRPQIKGLLTKADEADLFNLANNFGIRHHNDRQKTDYDPEIWLDWMFYYYLATCRTLLRLIGKGVTGN